MELTEKKVEELVNTPLGLKIRKIIDPLLERGEVELLNLLSVRKLVIESPGSIQTLPTGVRMEETRPCGCLLGVLNYAIDGRNAYPQRHFLSKMLGITETDVSQLENGFENPTEGDASKMTLLGRAIALHYGLE